MNRNSLERVISAVPSFVAVRRLPDTQQSLDLNKYMEQYLYDLLRDLDLSDAIITNILSASKNDFKKVLYSNLVNALLKEDDIRLLDKMNWSVEGSRYMSAPQVVGTYLMSNTDQYIDSLNSYNISSIYMIMFHANDIIKRDEDDNIVSIEREQLVYKKRRQSNEG